MTDEVKSTAPNMPINETLIDEVSKEVDANIDAEVAKVKEEYASKFNSLEEKLNTLTTKDQQREVEKEKSEMEKMQEELNAIKKENETIKADFDKKLEAISLRKSVSVNDVKEESAAPPKYSELDPKGKVDKDREWFASQGLLY